MNDTRRQLMKEKQEKLQSKLQLLQWLKLWRPLFDEVAKSGITFSWVYFECTAEEKRGHFAELISLPDFNGIPVSMHDIHSPATYPVHQQLLELFPSVLPLRYLPRWPPLLSNEEDFQKGFIQATTSLAINMDEQVHFFFNRYPPVFSLRLGDLLLIHPDLFADPEDITIAARDYRWFIFRSMEFEWTWTMR